MIKKTISKEQLAYAQAKDKYLETGRRYSSLLSRVMNLDPNILKIVEEIMMTGDSLSAHDNRFLTSFYKELRNKSKIDKKYYDILLELKKTKNELDNAVNKLTAARIAYFLRKSGIPPRRTNQSRDIIAAQINNPAVSLLEKISLPGILDLESSESLEELLASGELICKSGNLVPKTKVARNFIRNLETGIQQNVNNVYMLSNDSNLLAKHGKLDASNVLEFVRTTADAEHIREIERKIATGVISLTEKGLVATNPKGDKYIRLLVEELSAQYDMKLQQQLLEKNKKHGSNDPRLGLVSDSLKDLDISIGKHARLQKLAGNDTYYGTLLSQASGKKAHIEKQFAELMTLQETVSSAFVDIKKQLLTVVNKKEIEIEKVLSLMTAVRYLSVFEDKYEAKLTKLESLLGITYEANAMNLGPETIAKIAENYGEPEDSETEEANQAVLELISSRLGGRHELGSDTNKLMIRFLLDSPQLLEYRSSLNSQQSARKHVVDTLYGSDCLYQGFGNISEILAELAELEVEKKEKLADLAHELELAHKEFWLSNITNNSRNYIDNNFGELSEKVRSKAQAAFKDAVKAARKEIRETLSKYRAEHKNHSDEFSAELRKSLSEISKGGDVSKISSNLRAKYTKMNKNHEVLMANMEKDILALEKRLSDFEAKGPRELDKLLISDIRAKI